MPEIKRFLSPVIVILLIFLTSCNGAADSPSAQFIDTPELIVPGYVTDEGEAGLIDGRLWLQDYSNYLHAVQLMATVSRDSEYGNDAYRPELYPDEMIRRAEQWLTLVRYTDFIFNDDGRFVPWIGEQADGHFLSSDIDLSVFPHLVYAYHIHHRSGRFDFDETLYNRLNREATNYLVTPGQYLINEHFADGRFVNNDGNADHRSMSYGLGGIHGNAYSWIVWGKPGGEDTMGVIEEAVLEHWMGHGIAEMVQIYRNLAEAMDNAWLEDQSIYDFGDGTTWQLDAIGAMLRGKKAMYDFLYMFGDDGDRETSLQLFERAAAMLESVIPLARSWGLPDMIEFTENGALAASESVDLYNWYQFLNHLGGGYGFDREREGMPMYITEKREDLFDAFGELSDKALKGALQYHLNDEGLLFTTVDFSDGSPSDQRLSVSTAGMFITMAANNYRKGSAFERASDWDRVDSEVADRSRALYDLKFSLMERLDAVVSMPEDDSVSNL